MRPERDGTKRDIAIFVGLVLLYSIPLSYVLRNALSNSMLAIAIGSVFLAARGLDWRRKLIGAGAVLGGFLLFEFLYGYLGLTSRMATYGMDLVGTTLGLLYIVVTFSYPLVVLLLLVGRDPSVLWRR